MPGQYPPTLPPYFVVCFLVWICHLFPYGQNLINENQGKIPTICQIREIGDLFLGADKEARTQAEKVKLSSSCFLHSRSNCLMGKMLGRNCVSCYLGSPPEEMKHFSLLCFQCTKQLKIFVLESSCRSWDDLEIFPLCTYTYYMFVCNTV